MHFVGIANEVGALGREHPWAGRYSAHCQPELVLAPESGFWITNGESTRVGRVSVDPAAVMLHLQGTVQRLAVVSWGPRRYLVEPARWPLFLDAVRRGDEPRRSRAGEFLLRDGDEWSPIEGEPEIAATISRGGA